MKKTASAVHHSTVVRKVSSKRSCDENTCFDTALFFYNIVNSARIHLIFISVETGGKGLSVEFYRSD